MHRTAQAKQPEARSPTTMVFPYSLRATWTDGNQLALGVRVRKIATASLDTPATARNSRHSPTTRRGQHRCCAGPGPSRAHACVWPRRRSRCLKQTSTYRVRLCRVDGAVGPSAPSATAQGARACAREETPGNKRRPTDAPRLDSLRRACGRPRKRGAVQQVCRQLHEAAADAGIHRHVRVWC